MSEIVLRDLKWSNAFSGFFSCIDCSNISFLVTYNAKNVNEFYQRFVKLSITTPNF